MSNRVNKLFSPDKLRKRWAGTESTEEVKESSPLVDPTREEALLHPKTLERELSSYLRLPSGPAISKLLAELRSLVDERFPAEDEEPSLKREVAVVQAEIEGTLNSLEDLMEAARYSRFSP